MGGILGPRTPRASGIPRRAGQHIPQTVHHLDLHIQLLVVGPHQNLQDLHILGQWLAVKLEHRGQAQQKLVSVGLHMGYMCCILLEQLWVLLVGMDQRLLHCNVSCMTESPGLGYNRE